jgi:hypothetical protein
MQTVAWAEIFEYILFRSMGMIIWPTPACASAARLFGVSRSTLSCAPLTTLPALSSAMYRGPAHLRPWAPQSQERRLPKRRRPSRSHPPHRPPQSRRERRHRQRQVPAMHCPSRRQARAENQKHHYKRRRQSCHRARHQPRLSLSRRQRRQAAVQNRQRRLPLQSFRRRRPLRSRSRPRPQVLQSLHRHRRKCRQRG